MPRYYTLEVKVDGKWSPQFGAYEREDVDFERRQAARDFNVRIRDTKVTTWDRCPTQKQVMELCARLDLRDQNGRP